MCDEQKDLLEKAPLAFIAVHVVDALPIARQVNVEPCTADDWELIQLHAGSIEVELLRQVRRPAVKVLSVAVGSLDMTFCDGRCAS